MLYIAQPTVSQHIRQLEREVGIPLFERVGKRVKLTPAGRRFLPYAKRLLDEWNSGMEDLHAWRQGYTEKLQLAVSPMVARTSLPHLIHRYTRLYPHVDIVIRIEESVEIGAYVQNGEVDLGLSRMVPGELQVEAHVISSEPIVFAVPQNGGDMEAPLPDWEQELTSKTLLTHNHPGYWDDLLLLFRQRGYALHTMVVSQVDITKRFIEEGLGVSFVPRSAITREVFENRLMELETPGLTLPTVSSYLILPKTGLSETARRFVEVLQSLYAPLTKVEK